MDDLTQRLSPKPKAFRRKRLIVLLMMLAIVVTIYLPLRTNRANDRLNQSLLTGDVEGARYALDNGADPDLTQNLSPTSEPHRSLIDFVRLLLHRSLRPADNTARTALMTAAHHGDEEIVAALLQHGANVNRRLENGYTALLYAAPKSSAEIVEALLARGADIHAQSREGLTPLLAAAQAGQTQNVRLLLAKGADIHETDRHAQTALLLAVESRREETIQLLLAQGADADDLKGARLTPNSPTMRFVSTGPNRGLLTVNGVTTVVLGGLPPQLRPQSPPVIPPLLFASKYGSPSLLKFLWAQTDPNTKQQLAWNALCNASASAQSEAVRFLLEQNVSPNLPNAAPVDRRPTVHFVNEYDPNKVYTPLHFAAALPNPEIARLLITHGANVNAADQFGTTPLLAAVSGGHMATLRLLIEQGANVGAIETTSRQNALMRGVRDVETARLLLDHGLDVNAHDINGRTALMQCASAQLVALYLERGIDVNARDNQGRTALSQCFSTPVAALLIAHGATIDTRDNRGDTPLMAAIRTSQVDFARLLLKHGASLHNVNNQGETPLFAAQATRYEPMISLLVEAGAER